jgi:hypothetical protein
MTIVNDYSRVVNKLETSLTDDARVAIYNRHVFIVQATGLLKIGKQRQWKRISCKQGAKWQHLSWLTARAFFSLQQKILVDKKHYNLYLRLVTPSGG